MSCDQARTEMIAYLKNELDETRKERFEEHIAACPACRRELDEGRRTLLWTSAAADEAVTAIVESAINGAIAAGASDIHVEPQRDNNLRIRYRVDGVLHETMTIPATPRYGVVARLKMLADMAVSDSHTPQDGRIAWKYEDKDYDLRVSSVPFVFGEGLVIRIMDTAKVPGLQNVGLAPADMERIADWLQRPTGLIVVAGPTGSGKTTTMYSMLRTVNSLENKIVTIEDPVECVLPGVNHAHVNKNVGYTFAVALRSLLRHDPDIIMVGETRDLETAELELEAAITGHLVLASLHTTDSPSALVRLVDMGIEPFLISAVVIGVMSQRLVRRVCNECQEGYEIKATELRRFGFKTGDTGETLTIYRGKGCDACRGTGFKNRIGIYELMPMSADLAELVVRRAPLDELREAARANGMRDLREDALQKVLAGVTSPEEAMRVLV